MNIEVLTDDFYRNKGKKISKKEIIKLFIRRKKDPMKFIFSFRLAQGYYNKKIMGRIYKLVYRHYSQKYNFEIPLETQIGKGLRIPHWSGNITVHKNTKIGENCEIMQGVTIRK